MPIKRVKRAGGFEEVEFSKPVSTEELNEFFARENNVEIKNEQEENNPEASVELGHMEDELAALRAYEEEYRKENPDYAKRNDIENK